MRNVFSSLLLAGLMATSLGAAAQSQNPQPHIQMAILLDGSGSMQGLINQARRQIWKIVNELGRATKGGVTPKLEISVYEYGKDDLPEEGGFLRQLISLSTDLDGVSEKLRTINAQGSKEYTGMAIQAATVDLQWSGNPGDYKAIFISGNETMDQGPVNYLNAARAARAAGIVVNTIHAKGTAEHDMIRDGWQAAADAGGGKALEIALNLNEKVYPTLVDDEILGLNKDLNATYVPYGQFGQSEYDKMIRADDAAGSDGSLIERGLSKSGGYYNGYIENWDLVAAATSFKYGVEAFLRTLTERDLPENMRRMSIAERVIFINDKSFERNEIMKGIKDLSNVRQDLIDREMAKDQDSALAGLDKAMVAMLREQLSAKGFDRAK